MVALETIDEIRDRIRSLKKKDKAIGFVPTMGALHEGHLSLIDMARDHADEIVVSIYVNPEQFGPGEDFDEYPRQMDIDLERCLEAGVSTVFAPTDEIMYGGEHFLRIEIDALNDYMDGRSRPGFFEGIVLVVNKLFNIIEPDIAVFGQKDIQQYRILERLVSEFNHPVKLKMGPTVRANDGLALSSRNAYLNSEQRQIAPGLYRSLKYLEKQLSAKPANMELMIDHQKSELEAKGFEIDYLDIYSYDRMAPVKNVEEGDTYILAGAVYLGDTRLIDNIIVEL